MLTLLLLSRASFICQQQDHLRNKTNYVKILIAYSLIKNY